MSSQALAPALAETPAGQPALAGADLPTRSALAAAALALLLAAAIFALLAALGLWLAAAVFHSGSLR